MWHVTCSMLYNQFDQSLGNALSCHDGMTGITLSPVETAQET